MSYGQSDSRIGHVSLHLTYQQRLKDLPDIAQRQNGLYNDENPFGFPGLLSSERRARFQRSGKVPLLRQALKMPVNIISLIIIIILQTRLETPPKP